MAKNISQQRRAALSSPLTTDNTLWFVKRRDGTVFGFTDSDVDITYNGVTYKALSGYTPSTLESTAGKDVANLDVVSMLSDTQITEPDLRKGLWDFAEVEILSINRERPDDGIIVLRYGWLGEVEISGDEFRAEVRGIMQALKQKQSSVYQPLCRANLGDDKCRVNLSAFTDDGTVDSFIGSSISLRFQSSRPNTFFTGGKLTWTSGQNTGLSIEIRDNPEPGLVVLAMPPVFTVENGDTFSIHAGCQKRAILDCKNKFDNIVNFRGEPYLPGSDKVLDYPDAKN